MNQQVNDHENPIHESHSHLPIFSMTLHPKLPNSSNSRAFTMATSPSACANLAKAVAVKYNGSEAGTPRMCVVMSMSWQAQTRYTKGWDGQNGQNIVEVCVSPQGCDTSFSSL